VNIGNGVYWGIWNELEFYFSGPLNLMDGLNHRVELIKVVGAGVSTTEINSIAWHIDQLCFQPVSSTINVVDYDYKNIKTQVYISNNPIGLFDISVIYTNAWVQVTKQRVITTTSNPFIIKFDVQVVQVDDHLEILKYNPTPAGGGGGDPLF
jgi:hypothetical protein